MMLRESTQANGKTVNLEGLADPNCKEIEGLEHSSILLEFADAFITRDAEKLAEVRDRMEAEMTPQAVVDAAGVAANFQRMVRLADSTGIPSDGPVAEMQADLVKPLGLDQYESAKNTLNR